MTRALQKLVHVGCRELGIDADTRRDLQRELTGKESLSDMAEPELTLVVDALKARGFTPRSTGRKPQARRADVRLIHVLWRKLGEADALKDPSRAGLNAFVRKRFEENWGGAAPADVDMLSDPLQIDDVVQGLKAWGKRENIDFDWGRGQR